MKTDLFALSCNLLLVTTHIFCADPCTGMVIPYADFINAPGSQRFYSLIELAGQRAVLISGSNRQSVDAAFRQFMEVRGPDQVDKVRSVIERVAREYCVLCATKETERLCDVLVPVELEHCMVRMQPCAHENDFTCSQYQHKVREALKQAAKQARECHEAMVSMPLMGEVITYAAE